MRLPVALILAALLSAAPAADADKGVSVDLGKIDVSKSLAKGGTYRLPTMGVRNAGTEPSSYVMGVSYLDGQTRRRPPEAWFEFEPREFELAPGETQPVEMTLHIPTSASPDDYASLLSAQIAPEGDGARVAAAAGARIEFTVSPSNAFEAWRLRARTVLDDYSPWSYVVPLAGVVLLAAVWLSRRFSFRLERRP